MTLRAVAIVLAMLVLALAGAGQGGTRGPPSGLTKHGRTIWNLEALLHDTFAAKEVWIHYVRGTGPGPLARTITARAVWNFSTASTALCCGGTWKYTFATAQNSEFVARRLARRLYAQLGASGGWIPLTVRGAYVSCRDGRWLHIHFGNGPANTLLGCLTAYRP